MKMIDVLNMMAEGEIKEGTKLIVSDGFQEFEYEYIKRYLTFVDEDLDELDERFNIEENFLNREVEMIPPKEKKYLIKINIRGLDKYFRYMNYVKKYEYVKVGDKVQTASHQTRFTKQELKSILPVREFLEDMEGKYELIEVEE